MNEEKNIRIKECCGLGWLALWVFLLLFSSYSIEGKLGRIAKALDGLVKQQQKLNENFNRLIIEQTKDSNN